VGELDQRVIPAQLAPGFEQQIDYFPGHEGVVPADAHDPAWIAFADDRGKTRQHILVVPPKDPQPEAVAPGFRDVVGRIRSRGEPPLRYLRRPQAVGDQFEHAAAGERSENLARKPSRA
jgi:hypothetical protein